MKPTIQKTQSQDFLWSTYRENRDSIPQEKLVKQYVHLVEQMANKMSLSIPQRIIPKENLVGLGYIGLTEAIKKFDYKKGFKFETFGLWRIKGAMLDGIRQMDWVPRGYGDKAKKLNQAYRHLEQTLMRTPTDDELCEYLDLSLEEVDKAMSTLSLSTMLSLNEPLNGSDDEGKQQSLQDMVKDDQSESQDRQMQMAEFQKLIALSIDKTPEKERLVVSLFYYEGLSQVEIAEVLNLTREGFPKFIHVRSFDYDKALKRKVFPSIPSYNAVFVRKLFRI